MSTGKHRTINAKITKVGIIIRERAVFCDNFCYSCRTNAVKGLLESGRTDLIVSAKISAIV